MINISIIIHPSIASIFYIAFLIFFGYFLILIIYYFALAFFGFAEEKRRTLESEEEEYPLLLASKFTIPVSVIIPARDEEDWINDSLGSVLNLNYPQLEIIVVDDGSTDNTFKVLNDKLGLTAFDKSYIRQFPYGGRIREVFKSDKYPNVTVILKAPGYKKAGAVNVGLNIARYKYICVMDADTVLERDALLKVMAEVEKDPDHVAGIGSYFGLSNGFNIKNGKIIERSFSYKPLIAYQNLEYIRSFIGNRIAWSKINAMPNIPGGFGIWRRDILYELGGYDKEFSSEDIEFTFRAHDYLIKNNKTDLKILMLPYFAGWTEGPSNVKALILQRNRWQRVVEETLWAYRHMAFNRRYGAFAIFVLPYYILYEVFGSFFEVVSIFMVALGAMLGILDLNTFLAIFSLMILTQGLISLMCILAFMRGRKLFSLGYTLYLAALGFLEFFWYRWIISFAKISGTYSYSKGVRVYDKYIREKR